MATLAELAVLHSRGTNETEALLERIKAAVLIAADAISTEPSGTTNHKERLLWAKEAFKNPRQQAEDMFGAMLAANAQFPPNAILTAADPDVQAAVNEALNVFLTLS